MYECERWSTTFYSFYNQQVSHSIVQVQSESFSSGMDIMEVKSENKQNILIILL